MSTLILIKCTNFDPYLMALHVQTEGDKLVFSSEKMRLLLTLFESKPHIIIIFHLKTNKLKLEKHHVNGFQTRNVDGGQKVLCITCPTLNHSVFCLIYPT